MLGSRREVIMHNIINSTCHDSMIARMLWLKEPCPSDEMDIVFQIHKMEKEAYCSVLRAFIAQSDLLSWSKEGLMTELRKELNVTDSEHGQLLVEIKSDESIKKIKEWQKGAHELRSSIPYTATTPSVLPAHFRGDRRIVSGKSAKYAKIDHNFQGSPCSRGGSVQPQLKQGYQAPDYGNFKSCVKFVDHRIQEPPYSREGSVQPQMMQGCQEPDSGNISVHMKVVDHNSQEPSNIREEPVQTQMNQGSQAPDYGNFRARTKIVDHNTQGPVCNRVVPPKYQLKHKTQGPGGGHFKHCSEVIDIRVTDEVIHEVEAMTSGASSFDPVQIGKAKLILSMHESAILEALNKLADVSDEGFWC